MKAVLTRLEADDQGTFGVLDFEGRRWFTGELPWRDNQANISCVPPGVYPCRLTYSPRFLRPLYLVDLEGRLGVRIHPANFMGDASKKLLCQLNGCIALGEKRGIMEGQKAILVSQPAVEQFQALAAGRPFDLEIRHAGS